MVDTISLAEWPAICEFDISAHPEADKQQKNDYIFQNTRDVKFVFICG